MPELTAIESHPLSHTPFSLRGWRVVRLLGASPSVTTALVLPLRAATPQRPRVLRLFSASTPDDRIDQEVAIHDALAAAGETACDGADGHCRPHWVRAEALVSADDGRLGLLFEAVGGPTVAAWLDEHGPVRRGEVSTLLAPIAEAVQLAHDHGVMGIVPNLTGMRLDSARTPIIVALHHSAVRPALPEKFRSSDALYEHDRQVLARLVDAVAEHVDTDDRSAVRALAACALDSPLALRDALLHEARPEPLVAAETRSRSAHRLSGSREGASATVPVGDSQALSDVAGALTVPHVASFGRAARARVGEVVTSLGVPGALHERIDDALARTFRVVDRLASAACTSRLVSAVRPRFLLLGAAGAVALSATLALAAVPVQGVDGVASDKPAVASEAPQGYGDNAVSPHQRSEAQPLGDADSSSTTSPDVLENPAIDDWNPLVEQLLQRWSACRALAGEGCNDDVAQPLSAAALLLSVDDDRHAVIDAWLLGDRELVVVERMGSAALVDLIEAERTTASLLLMRSEAGWRVRDVVG